MLKLIKDYTPLIASLFIFLGVSKQYFYYLEFDINIINYLNFGEILTSFLDDLQFIVLFYLTLIILAIILISPTIYSSKIEKIDASQEIKKIESKYNKPYLIIYIFIFLTFTYLLYNHTLKFSIGLNYIYIFLAYQVISRIILLLTSKSNNVFTTSSLFLVPFMVYLMLKLDLQKLRTDKKAYLIQTNSETIPCNKTTKNIFIGKTENYLFVFNDSTKSSIIIPTSSIVKIESQK